MNVLRNSLHNRHLRRCHEAHVEKLLVRFYSIKKSARKEQPTIKALKHFDEFYGGIYKKKWHSIRLGLLSKPKHVALLNNFADLKETEHFLKCEGALDLRVLLKSEKDEDEEDDKTQCTELFAEANEEKDEIKAVYPEGSEKNYGKLFESYKINPKTDESSDDHEEDKETSVTKLEDSGISMHEALSQSQIDTSRVIDPSAGLDMSSLQEFVPVTKLKGQEEFVPEGDYYRFYKVTPDIPVSVEKEHELVFPEFLRVYSYPRGDVSSFPSPRKCVSGVYNYYPLDGASILVVLALGLQPGDHVLDMCAGPGGKSLAIFQTFLPKVLVCNDCSFSRSKRIQNVFHQYVHDFPDNWKNVVSFTIQQAERYEGYFNKILVDVPCTVDRHSVSVDENNIFKGSRIKERLKLPEHQAEILENALKIVSPGGTVVYSTCTLSPIQNDGVVNLALQKVWKEYGMEFTVRDLSPAMEKLSSFYRISNLGDLQYGSLILPFVPVNFGPMYMCKLVKNT